MKQNITQEQINIKLMNLLEREYKISNDFKILIHKTLKDINWLNAGWNNYKHLIHQLLLIRMSYEDIKIILTFYKIPKYCKLDTIKNSLIDFELYLLQFVQHFVWAIDTL